MEKRVWSIVNAVLLMLRKGISKRKLMIDLNLMIKRGKIATKAIGNLMFHHHHHCNRRAPPEDHRISSLVHQPQEFEFSCSNTPTLNFPGFQLHHNRRKSTAGFFACAHATPTLDDEVTTANTFKVAVEMLSSRDVTVEASPSPMLPGFGHRRSPVVRQLRITDSPFPLRDVDEDYNGQVDKAAEEFIKKFYKKLKLQE